MFSVGILLCFCIVNVQLISAISLNETNLLDHLDRLDDFKPSKELINKCPFYVSGFDREKRPVLIVEIGNWPIRKTVEKGGKELADMTKYVLQAFRKVQLGARPFFNENDLEAEDAVVIMDWEGFSFSQLIHRETNAAALQLFNLARPILGSVMERVEIVGTQKNTWIPKLLRKIPKDQLPPWYGGEKGDFKPVVVYG